MSEERRESDEIQNGWTGTESIEGISLNALYSLLSHHHRRAVVELLLVHDRAVTLRDLRNEIVEAEYGGDITEAPDERAADVLGSLYHVHVPKLADEGIVDYDPDRALVEPTEKLSRLEPHLPPL